ncbi:unnamed protein product [Dovyalis caffra]|uniref:PHD-type domain-containing protein n=1 Tax=Dovyalis caffra TaxID=77055 RepID=A0AAV1SPG6_9ROSI|nr:unnamed protein product [Dovyalis caffra]
MLLHDLVPSSVEAALPFTSNYSRQDLFSECGEEEKEAPKKSAIMSSIEPETDKAPTNALNGDPRVINIDYNIDDGVRVRTIPIENFEGLGFCKPIDSELQSTSSHKELISSVVAQVGSVTTRINISNIAEHPDSDIEVSGDDLSIRELCTSVLRSHGLLAGDCPVSNDAPTEVLVNTKNENFFQSCELCGNFEIALNMLLCDHCEEAFHVSCCNLNMEMLPTDLWFCQSCSKLNHNVSQETSFLKTHSISWWNEKYKLSPIASMLKYPEAHTSRVRIGTSYQAAVPEWSDQLSMDSDCIGEPLEIDPSQTVCLHECPQDKSSNAKAMSNWLQCREVLHDDAREGAEGTICGKWRSSRLKKFSNYRAPFSEVQTDYWDCSCSVLWDPSHSDCAVPQELETDEVLQQLKYVEQLRSRLVTKKRRIP